MKDNFSKYNNNDYSSKFVKNFKLQEEKIEGENEQYMKLKSENDKKLNNINQLLKSKLKKKEVNEEYDESESEIKKRKDITEEEDSEFLKQNIKNLKVLSSGQASEYKLDKKKSNNNDNPITSYKNKPIKKIKKERPKTVLNKNDKFYNNKKLIESEIKKKDKKSKAQIRDEYSKKVKNKDKLNENAINTNTSKEKEKSTNVMTNTNATTNNKFSNTLYNNKFFVNIHSKEKDKIHSTSKDKEYEIYGIKRPHTSLHSHDKIKSKSIDKMIGVLKINLKRIPLDKSNKFNEDKNKEISDFDFDDIPCYNTKFIKLDSNGNVESVQDSVLRKTSQSVLKISNKKKSVKQGLETLNSSFKRKLDMIKKRRQYNKIPSFYDKLKVEIEKKSKNCSKYNTFKKLPDTYSCMYIERNKGRKKLYMTLASFLNNLTVKKKKKLSIKSGYISKPNINMNAVSKTFKNIVGPYKEILADIFEKRKGIIEAKKREKEMIKKQEIEEDFVEENSSNRASLLKRKKYNNSLNHSYIYREENSSRKNEKSQESEKTTKRGTKTIKSIKSKTRKTYFSLQTNKNIPNLEAMKISKLTNDMNHNNENNDNNDDIIFNPIKRYTSQLVIMNKNPFFNEKETSIKSQYENPTIQSSERYVKEDRKLKINNELINETKNPNELTKIDEIDKSYTTPLTVKNINSQINSSSLFDLENLNQRKFTELIHSYNKYDDHDINNLISTVYNKNKLEETSNNFKFDDEDGSSCVSSVKNEKELKINRIALKRAQNEIEKKNKILLEILCKLIINLKHKVTAKMIRN